MEQVLTFFVIFISLNQFPLCVSDNHNLNGRDGNCAKKTSCIECTTSTDHCNWCFSGNFCTNNATFDCIGEYAITGTGVSWSSNEQIHPQFQRKKIHLQRSHRLYSGPEFCPSIRADVEGNKIIATMGATKKVVVKLNISNDGLLPAFRFTCEFKIDGKSTTVNGRLFGEKLYCDAVQLMYSADSPNVSATFNVLRNGLIPLANPDNIHGNLFQNEILFHVNDIILNFQLSFIDAVNQMPGAKSVSNCQKN